MDENVGAKEGAGGTSAAHTADLAREVQVLRDECERMRVQNAECTAELGRAVRDLAETGRLAQVGGWELDLVTGRLSWSDVVRAIHEVAPDYQPDVESAVQFYAPSAVPVISEAVQLAIDEQRPFDLELPFITAKGRAIWVRAIGEAQREDGRAVRVRGVFQDITSRRAAEDELRRHRDHLEQLVAERTAELGAERAKLVEAQAIAHLGSWEWDAVRDAITGSAQFYALFDVQPPEIVRFEQFVERLHPEDRTRVQADVADALAARRDYDTDYRIRTSDGGWRHINARGAAELDEQGTPLRMLGTCLDMTERKLAEQAAVQEAEKARTFLDNTKDLVTIVDPAGKLTYVNRAAHDFFGASPDELVGTLAFDRIHPDDQAATQDAFVGWLRDGVTSASWENRQLAFDGSVRHVLWTIMPRYQDAELDSIWSIARDISDRKAAEEAIRSANAELQRSNEELEQFAYVASHDLQEPLRMVASFTQLLAERYEGKLDEKADKYIHFAVDGARRMQGLINDLLAFSRVGTRAKPFTQVESGEVATEVLRVLQRVVDEAGAEVRLGALPTVLADRIQLGQLLQNLVENAIKFRGEAPPLVEISARRDDAPGAGSSGPTGRWLFEVKDNGIGVAPEYFDRIFVIFQRLHERGRYDGNGIGLAIARKIAERHGGTLWVESNPGEGASFRFTLPAAETTLPVSSNGRGA